MHRFKVIPPHPPLYKYENRHINSQLKRERSAFQGTIPSKDEAANNLNRMKIHRILLQTFSSWRQACRIGQFGGTSRVEPNPRTGNMDRESQVRRTLDSVRPPLRAKLGHLIIIIWMCIRTEYHRLLIVFLVP